MAWSTDRKPATELSSLLGGTDTWRSERLLCWLRMRQPEIITISPPPNCTAPRLTPKKSRTYDPMKSDAISRTNAVHRHPHGDGAPHAHVVAFDHVGKYRRHPQRINDGQQRGIHQQDIADDCVHVSKQDSRNGRLLCSDFCVPLTKLCFAGSMGEPSRGENRNR